MCANFDTTDLYDRTTVEIDPYLGEMEAIFSLIEHVYAL